jgi:hypothetical protein
MKTTNATSGRRNEGGMATIVFIVLLTIMVILMTANTRSLIRLHRDTLFLEKQQIKRLMGPETNTVGSVSTNVEK